VTHVEDFAWYKREGVAVVCPPGEIDLYNADRLRVSCYDAVDASCPDLVVDLSGTTFMDATALAVFVGVSKRLQAQGGWLRLVTGDSTAVQKILKVTGLDGILGNFQNIDAAIAQSCNSNSPGPPLAEGGNA
jgi:anti-sigma B factor antagonist